MLDIAMLVLSSFQLGPCGLFVSMQLCPKFFGRNKHSAAGWFVLFCVVCIVRQMPGCCPAKRGTTPKVGVSCLAGEHVNANVM